MPVVEEFLKVSDVKNKEQFNLSTSWKGEALFRLPWVPEVFYRVWRDTQVSEGRSHERRSREKKTYKYSTETGNRARSVSGTQGIFR